MLVKDQVILKYTSRKILGREGDRPWISGSGVQIRGFGVQIRGLRETPPGGPPRDPGTPGISPPGPGFPPRKSPESRIPGGPPPGPRKSRISGGSSRGPSPRGPRKGGFSGVRRARRGPKTRFLGGPRGGSPGGPFRGSEIGNPCPDFGGFSGCRGPFNKCIFRSVFGVFFRARGARNSVTRGVSGRSPGGGPRGGSGPGFRDGSWGWILGILGMSS